MTNLEAARIMMDGSGGSPVDEVNKLIITNGTFTPDAGQMWNKVAVYQDRYYSVYGNTQNYINYNWELYSHLASLNHGFHFKMGSKYHVKVQADAKFYPQINYYFKSETNADPTIYEKYFVTWRSKDNQGRVDNRGFWILPSLFFTIYENDNPIPIFITQTVLDDVSSVHWERRSEFQLADTIHSGNQQRVIAGEPRLNVYPPHLIRYQFVNYYPTPAQGIAPEIQFILYFTNVWEDYTGCYHVDGTTDPPYTRDVQVDRYVNISPPFYYRTRWHSVDLETAMYHVLRMQTDINLNGLYTGEYNEQSS